MLARNERGSNVVFPSGDGAKLADERQRCATGNASNAPNYSATHGQSYQIDPLIPSLID